ncbi:TPA: amino acid permease [Candidatus Dependentiae bacterium]|nr:MAG: Amino acid permease-associated region [candidate division TM6 bacterium GW2011_GWE2_31_21]KKP53863.1 MAG: Amino acid permease-associated region [candidate division TM6 bacterium GW2011_GWF2_33_332]HBS47643.1 amino acid permease [Candidatus Dependentiae bacterium]HBZ73792.1 amino acid permease [Candidatus Dependentiae bacterium]
MANKTYIPKTMSLFSLIMISSAFTISVRNFPSEAETGMHMIFFALIAAICFFIPVALISAELATGWPIEGGVYVWIKEAFGNRLGFVGIWLQWNYMILGIISMLYFVGGTMAFIFAPHLAQSRVFLISILLIVLWGVTIFNLRGQKTSNIISTIGFLGGVLLPGLLIIILGIIYVIKGNPLNLDLSFTSKNLIPNFKQFSTLVLLVSFMKAFAGIEASSSHAAEVTNPKINYPIAIFVVVVLGLLLNILGAFSVAIVVPQKDINLFAGLMDAFTIFFSKFNMQRIIPLIGILVAGGAIGGISTWIMGPVRGLLATAQNGELPLFFQKINKNGAPVNLLIIQATMTSLIGCSLLLLPNLNIAFWISVAIAMVIYFVMYALMILSALRLRYTAPNVDRTYKVPGGKIGIWIISIIGLATLLFSGIISILPPDQLSSKNVTLYETFLIVIIFIIIAIPFIINQFKKSSWKSTSKKKV